MTLTSGSGAWGQDSLGSGSAGSTLMKRTPNLKQVAKAKAVRDDWDDDDDDDDEGDEPEKDVAGREESDGNGKTNFTRNNGTPSGPGSSRRGEGALAEARKGEDSTRIWEEANSRGPMPELIVAPASTSQSSPPPPPAALQPTLRILKRPSPNASGNNTRTLSSASLSPSSQGHHSTGSGSSSGVTSPGPRGTLAEREAQYQEARSRIFGDQLGNATGDASSVSMSSTSGGVVVVREPLGPASETDMMEPGNGQDKARGGSDRPAKGFGERRRGRK